METPATAPPPDSPLALEPDCEWKLGDRIVGSGGVGVPPYLYVGDCRSDLSGRRRPEDVWFRFNSHLSRGHDAARCEWKTKVDCYDPSVDSEYEDWATVRLIWRRAAPLELDVWTGRDVLPSEETTHAIEEAYLRYKMLSLLGESQHNLSTVSLLTAMRLTDVLQGDGSRWVVHP